MACFRPIYGWQKTRWTGGYNTDGTKQLQQEGPLSFGAERPQSRKVDIPCGYCLGCRLAKSRAWAIRCMHEAHMHPQNSFITLTYSDANYRPGLNYADFKKFIRRLTAAQGPTRYFMCGEYGDKWKRPHFHAILFGQTFNDQKNFGRVNTSETLDKLWGLGFTTVGQATHESAGYVARYTTKKVYGRAADTHYMRVDLHTGETIKVRPEFAQMSRRPGIGQKFLEKYWPEIYDARDGVIQPGGKKQKAPRYYDEWLKKHNHDLKDWKDYERYINSKQFIHETTPQRLATRELIALENMKRKLRTLEI